MKMLLQKKWMLSLAFLFVGWCAMAQTPTLPAGAGTSGDPYQIATLDNLYWVTQNTVSWAAGKYFIQTADIDASSTSTWHSGAGFSPIGNSTTDFQGNYNGDGHTITGLYINRPTTDYVGLFGNTSSATISNLKLVSCSITGQSYVGAIVGFGITTISNSSSSGSVAGQYRIGGIIGNGASSNCTDCNSSCTVNGINYVGGFTGNMYSSNFTNCSSTGTVTATDNEIGGFVGEAVEGSFNNCFSTSNVSGLSAIGGFAGLAAEGDNILTIKNCYAKGIVTGTEQVGGFAGQVSFSSGEITNCYSSSVVTGTSSVNGFIGFYGGGTFTNCYFDADVDGLAETSTGTDNYGATGKTTAEMKTQATFTGWDFATTPPVWKIDANNSGYPYLAWQTFASDAPTITSFTPTTAGTGTFISITGTNFTNASSVKFGGTEAVSFIVDNATTISAKVGSGTTGTISVTTPGGTATSAGTFTFKPAFLTNLANTIASSVGGGTTNYNGQAFSTGNHARSLSSVDLSITLNGADAVVKIYSSSSGNMGSEIASLTGTYVSGSIYNFTPASPVTLLANTTYWLVLYSIDNTTFDYTDDVTYTGTATIPSTNRTAFSANAGGTWEYYSASDPDPNYSSPFMFALYGDIVISATWTGATSTNWNTAVNWSTNAVPTGNDNVVIDNAGTAPIIVPNVAASCYNITVNAGASLTINSDASLITYGTITNNGTININRDITEETWHLVSIPTVTANANVFLGDYLQGYNESTAKWSDIIPSVTPLTPVNGYALWATTSPGKGAGFPYTFTGIPNTGNQSLAFTAEKEYGWNLMGNPYPSYLDWDAVIASQTNMNGAVYCYNGTTCVSYNGGIGGGSRYIAPMQGFFISATSNGTLNLANSHRTHTSGTFYKGKEIPDHYLRLTTNSNNITDELHIRFNESATPDFDGQFDAWKLLSWNEQAPQLYSFSGSEILSIDQRPACEMIQLGFSAATAGVYSIAVNEMTDFDNTILEDTKTNTFHDLTKGQYDFLWETTDDEKRFKLHLNSVGIEETLISESNILIYAANNQIFIKDAESGEVMVSDVMGRIIVKEEIVGSGMITVPVKLETGIYLVTVKSNGEVKTEKVFIR